MKNILSGLALSALMATSLGSLNAQSSKSFGEIFIPNKASVSIFSKHSFHDGANGMYPGVIATERDNQKGYFHFATGSSWVGASDMQHVDGYVKVHHNEAFTFPVGANSRFRPIAISGAAKTSAAYYDSNPSYINESGTEKTELTIQRLTDQEYWDVDGDKATHLTLTWDVMSSIEALTDGDLDALAIVGWRNNQWEVIPSSIDRFTLDASSSRAQMGLEIADFSRGSISTNEAFRPSDYDYYTLAAINQNALGKIQPEFDVYPNPQILRLELSVNYKFPTEDGGTIRIYSPNNILLMEKEISDQRGIAKLPNATDKAGVYVIGIVDRNGNASYQKLVIVEE